VTRPAKKLARKFFEIRMSNETEKSIRLPWCLGALVVNFPAFNPKASGHVKAGPKKSGLKTLKMYTTPRPSSVVIGTF